MSRVASGQLPPRNHLLITALLISVGGMAFFIVVCMLLTPTIQALYGFNSDVYFAPAHFNDARQYALICAQGYNVPYITLPTLNVSRTNWMPVYALLQCGLHRLTGVSLVFTGMYISAMAIGLSLFLAAFSLANLGVRYPALHTLAVMMPPIGAAWLYLPGAEAIYLSIGMAVMWLITLPPNAETSDGRRRELIRVLAGIPLGMIFMLTKPNALAMLLPLTFAFFYQSWQRSKAAGYAYGLWSFVADVVIEHGRAALAAVGIRLTLSFRPIRYDWTAAAVVCGIVLGFAYWLAYTSLLSGIPNYFLQQQLSVWGRAWPSGNLGEMIMYFLQAFRPVDVGGSPWRWVAAWNLAANLTALIPAASPRVPALIRGMLPLMVVFLLYSGAVHGSDRYILSTALVALGWACWLAPQGQQENWSIVRWTLTLCLSVVGAYLLVWHMFPLGEPNAWGIVDR